MHTSSASKRAMSSTRFGTAINCIDGRVQEPVARWLRDRYHLDYVDVVTEPGPSHALLAEPEVAERIRESVLISVQRHGSTVVALVGHHDCAASPASKEKHWEQIRAGLQLVRFWNQPVTMVGLWVNEHWEVEVVEG